MVTYKKKFVTQSTNLIYCHLKSTCKQGCLIMHQSFVSPACKDWGEQGHSRAYVPCFDFCITPVVLWNSGAFDSMPKPAGVIWYFPAGIWARLWPYIFFRSARHIPGLLKEKSQYPYYSPDMVTNDKWIRESYMWPTSSSFSFGHVW